MYRFLILACLLVAIAACGDKSTPGTPDASIETEKRVTYITWQAARYENGNTGTADGYKVYCAPVPGYQPAIGVDVGDVTKYPLASMIYIDGLWYCSVAPYDSVQEYERQGEASVERKQGEFH